MSGRIRVLYVYVCNTNFNTLQHTAIHCNTLQQSLRLCVRAGILWACVSEEEHVCASVCLQHALQHYATHCKTLLQIEIGGKNVVGVCMSEKIGVCMQHAYRAMCVDACGESYV